MSHRSRYETPSWEEEKAMRTSSNRNGHGSVNTSARLSNETSSPPRQKPSSDRRKFDRSSKHDPLTWSNPRGRSRSRSPYRRGRSNSRSLSRSRSRSPFRASRYTSGEKRRRDGDHYSSRASSDPRRFKVHYEKGASKAENGSHRHDTRADIDERGSKSRRSQHDRDRSRSPYHHTKTEPESVGGDRPGSHDSSDYAGQRSKRHSYASSTENEPRPSEPKPPAAEPAKLAIREQETFVKPASGTPSATDVLNSVSSLGNAVIGEQAAAEPEQRKLSEAELIEQRRKRREAIKAKHKSQPPLLVQALEQNIVSAPSTPLHETSGGSSEQQSPPSSLDSPATPKPDSPAPGSPGSPASFTVNNDDELANHTLVHNTVNDEDGPSAADYDPNMDMQEDRPDHKRRDLVDTTKNLQPSQSALDQTATQPAKEFDMFAEDDDDDDMFAPEDSNMKPNSGVTKARALDASLLDNWDYPDGHYRIILGELLDNRYAVQQQIGKGTFATVVRAEDMKTGASVAVKIACNNDTMYKAGTREMDFLQLLNQQDADDKKHIIRLLRRFDHKGHMCLVFENLSADLREVLKKFGRNVGINIKAIRSYAQQMFLALSHMKKCQILHADLKPDNMLVSEKRSLLKICDLGTASFANDAEITPYLVSRFYRAPEVILGMPFDYAIDMWSVGCTLFELHTGRILFAGSDNNQMLRTIQECRGKIPNRMLKRSELIDKHFLGDGTFVSQERDKITGKATLRQMNFTKTAPGKDIKARLTANTKGMLPAELKELYSLIDLLDKCLKLDPAQRISPNEALRHPFIMHTAAPAGPSTAEAKSTKIKPAMNVQNYR